MKARFPVPVLVAAYLVGVLGFLLLSSGCGGGGGGGRQVLPGENPLGVDTTTLTTTTTTTSTTTSTATSTSTTTTTTTATSTATASPAQLLNDGWARMSTKDYSGAATRFQAVTTNASATASQTAEAHNGLGWAAAKSTGITSGITSFITAGNLVEARIGLALAMIQQNDLPSIQNAIGILEGLGLGDPTAVVTIAHPQIEVTNAELHASLAYAYFRRNQTGDRTKAKAQIEAARAADSSSTSSVAQIYNLLVEMGLYS